MFYGWGAVIAARPVLAEGPSQFVLMERAVEDEYRPSPLALRDSLPLSAHSTLAKLELNIRANPNPAEAYNIVPGRNPQIV